MSTKKEIAELLAHRDDPEEWEDAAVPMEAKGSRSTVISFRLPIPDAERLHEETRATGLRLSDYLRETLYQRWDSREARLRQPASLWAGSPIRMCAPERLDRTAAAQLRRSLRKVR